MLITARYSTAVKESVYLRENGIHSVVSLDFPHSSKSYFSFLETMMMTLLSVWLKKAARKKSVSLCLHLKKGEVIAQAAIASVILGRHCCCSSCQGWWHAARRRWRDKIVVDVLNGRDGGGPRILRFDHRGMVWYGVSGGGCLQSRQICLKCRRFCLHFSSDFSGLFTLFCVRQPEDDYTMR